MKRALEMLKIDLGITHKQRDSYFENMLNGCKGELAIKGVAIDLSVTEDLMLLCDYSAFLYRHRTESVPIPQNLMLRIRNRQVRRRANEP